jgi:fucose 4-O-acetylase-like acetyltransferase
MGRQDNVRRCQWIDAAKGIGIVSVIFVHVIVNLRDGRLLSVSGFWGDVIFSIFTFAMPVFMFLAGLFVRQRLDRGALAFLRPMGVTIIWPYLLWGSLALVAEYLGRDIRSPVDTSSVDITLLWTPIAWLWFLWALGIYHIIAVAIGRFPLVLVAVGLAALLGDSLLYVSDFIHKLAHFLIFYAIGVAAGPTILRYPLPAGTGICATILFVPLIWAASAAGPDPWSLTATGAATAGVIAVVAASQTLHSNVLLLFLGRRSMPLYVNHIFFIAAVRVVLARAVGVADPVLLIPACLVAAFCGPLLLLRLAEHLNMVGLMGLGRPVLKSSAQRAPIYFLGNVGPSVRSDVRCVNTSSQEIRRGVGLVEREVHPSKRFRV